jgi:hypothetical protein
MEYHARGEATGVVIQNDAIPVGQVRHQTTKLRQRIGDELLKKDEDNRQEQ